MNKNNILDDLVKRGEFDYMSDLRFDIREWDEKIKTVLSELDENAYSLENWKESISYLLDVKGADLMHLEDVHQAKNYILDVI